MLGYAGENERVLPAAAASDDSDSDADFAMDPSDPRAHDKSRQAQQLRVHPTRAPRRAKTRRAVTVGASVSRWDSDSQASEGDGGSDDSEDVGERVPVQVVFAEGDSDDSHEEDEPLGGADVDEPTLETSPAQDPAECQPPANSVKLSKWALSRFLVPREERSIPVFEELPIEPLNDHILSDFSTRHRGTAGDVDVAKAIESDESEDDEPDKLIVGAPLYAPGNKSTPDASSNVNADDSKGGKKRSDGESKAPSRRRPESRYFVTDLATKCFNCGQIGHMSSLCMNDRVLKPCYYCGLRGHMAMACPHLPCPTCLQLGHTARECSNSPPKSDNCGVCGRTGHDDEDCELSDAGFHDISCMVCVKTGHLHCVPIPPPADRKFYCPNCAEKHLLDDCSSYVEPSQPNYATSNFRMAMKCFVCQNPGHLAAECPQRSNQMNHFSCFKCGQRGHYASDCTSSSRSYNDNRQTGRKRGRDQFNSGSYDDDEDGDEGNHYYQVPGGAYGGSHSNSRRVYASSKSHSDSAVRLDSALPSYRNGGGYNSSNRNDSSNTSSKNGGGYKNSGNGDRRRGGNGGGGRWR